MFGRETFIVRVAEDAMAPRVQVGDYVWVDPDEPTADGHLVAVRDPGRGGATVVRLLIERDGRRLLLKIVPQLTPICPIQSGRSRNLSRQINVYLSEGYIHFERLEDVL